MSGGATEQKPNGDTYGAEVYVVVDVTDPRRPFTVVEHTDAYSMYRGNANAPSSSRISDVDWSYLKAAAHGLYGLDEMGNERVFTTFCQCNPSNRMTRQRDCGIGGGWNSLDIRYFVKHVTNIHICIFIYVYLLIYLCI